MEITDLDLNSDLCFNTEKTTLNGVKRVIEKVAKDINRVFGTNPLITERLGDSTKNVVLPMTIGYSQNLDSLIKSNKIDIKEIEGKWETYGFFIVENPFKEHPDVKNALVIVGSDKRGTIYGLFHLSEIIGVSPFVDFSDVRPSHLKTFTLTDKDNFVSKEPSVKYRGFFINDEWPAFGNWSMKHFGGFNAECYEHVFELLLRLKGNYMWPAMWSAVFSMDGPGLKNADLAEEYGIVMSTSHHESLGRAGEEHRRYRNTTGEYGMEWNFTHNRKGITDFWRDGLKRNKPYDNYYTVGMRGEADSAILGHEATLKDNIDLLKDVLTTQNKLIREELDEDISKIKRQFVLFSEVDKFYYGDEKTTGLQDTDLLDDVTIIMSDDNYGMIRALPDKKMAEHKGGLGLYYHYDFHGPTHCYEWCNENYLPRSWEQLTMAYEYGIRQIWVVNVGDIGLLELPLKYFMDMAYDFDANGTKHPNSTKKWTDDFLQSTFGSYFSSKDMELLKDTVNDYTQLNAAVKVETLKDDTYHVTNFLEADRVLSKAQKIIENAEHLKSQCPESMLGAFYEIFYYSAAGTANVNRIWITAAKNHLYARQNRAEANIYADLLESYIKYDEELTRQYHKVDGEKFYGFGLSEHLGFYSWNDEDCKKPIVMRIYPTAKPRILHNPKDKEEYLTGGPYSKTEMYIDAFTNQNITEYEIDLAPACSQEVSYKVRTDVEWLTTDKSEGIVSTKSSILKITCDRSMLEKGTEYTGTVFIDTSFSHVHFIFKAINEDTADLKPMTFIESQNLISIDASHYARKYDGNKYSFKVLEGYGKTGSAVKVMPFIHHSFNAGDEETPYLEYDFKATEEGTYAVDFYFSPTNPAFMDNAMGYAFGMNGEKAVAANIVDKKTFVTYFSPEWQYGADNNIQIRRQIVKVNKGLNTLRFYALDPTVILEKLVMHPAGNEVPYSYLGAPESYFVKAV